MALWRFLHKPKCWTNLHFDLMTMDGLWSGPFGHRGLNDQGSPWARASDKMTTKSWKMLTKKRLKNAYKNITATFVVVLCLFTYTGGVEGLICAQGAITHIIPVHPLPFNIKQSQIMQRNVYNVKDYTLNFVLQINGSWNCWRVYSIIRVVGII